MNLLISSNIQWDIVKTTVDKNILILILCHPQKQ